MQVSAGHLREAEAGVGRQPRTDVNRGPRHRGARVGRNRRCHVDVIISASGVYVPMFQEVAAPRWAVLG